MPQAQDQMQWGSRQRRSLYSLQKCELRALHVSESKLLSLHNVSVDMADTAPPRFTPQRRSSKIMAITTTTPTLLVPSSPEPYRQLGLCPTMAELMRPHQTCSANFAARPSPTAAAAAAATTRGAAAARIPTRASSMPLTAHTQYWARSRCRSCLAMQDMARASQSMSRLTCQATATTAASCIVRHLRTRHRLSHCRA